MAKLTGRPHLDCGARSVLHRPHQHGNRHQLSRAPHRRRGPAVRHVRQRARQI